MNTRSLALVAALGVAATLYWLASNDSRWVNERGAAAPSSVSEPAARTGAPAQPAAGAAPSAVGAAGEPQEQRPRQTDAALSSDAPAPGDLKGLVGGIDPLLLERNLIVPARGSQRDGPSLEDVELRFRAERTDAAWSKPMEARILDEVARVTGLGLAGLEAECREAICRLKLFHPPGTNALSSLDQLRPIASRIGFDHVLEVATLGEEGVPISLLYFQKDAA